MALTRSNLEKDCYFIIHVNEDYDYLIYSNKRDEIFGLMKMMYHNETRKNLPIYEVPADKIKSFATTESES